MPPPRLERADGRARIGFALRDGQTVLADLFQAGSAKIRLPRRHSGEIRDAVTINTSGGLTDGDRLCIDAEWGPGCIAAIASQAAERIYRSRAADAVIETSLQIGAGATAFWLPQETIVFDGGRVRRRCRVHLQGNARLLAVESLVFGRAAMDETVETGAVRERFDVFRDDELIWADAFALTDTIGDSLDRPAIGRGARAFASVIGAGPDPETLRDAVRAVDLPAGAQMGATLRAGLVIIRVIADDGARLRAVLMSLLATLKGALLADRPEFARPSALPRVWAL